MQCTGRMYPQVADVMPISCYKKIRKYLHVSDNTFAPSEENKRNRLYNIQPALDHVRNNCLKIVPELENSSKSIYSGIRQYNQKKTQSNGDLKTL